jgi:hypothetical protein
MSTYISKAINPKTQKVQTALFHDDHYGTHQYGVGFKKDGSDFTEQEFVKPQLPLDELDFYPIYQVEKYSDAPADVDEAMDTAERVSDDFLPSPEHFTEMLAKQSRS